MLQDVSITEFSNLNDCQEGKYIGPTQGPKDETDSGGAKLLSLEKVRKLSIDAVANRITLIFKFEFIQSLK